MIVEIMENELSRASRDGLFVTGFAMNGATLGFLGIETKLWLPSGEVYYVPQGTEWRPYPNVYYPIVVVDGLPPAEIMTATEKMQVKFGHSDPLMNGYTTSTGNYIAFGSPDTSTGNYIFSQDVVARSIG